MAAALAVAGSNVEFIRARSDKREYRRVVLPNALECLLISDADTDKAAACMEVGVGSFSDPDGLEGLAHFLDLQSKSMDVPYVKVEQVYGLVEVELSVL